MQVYAMLAVVIFVSTVHYNMYVPYNTLTSYYNSDKTLKSYCN